MTIALLVTGEMNIIRAISYICCQMCGSLLGAYIVKELVPEHLKAGINVIVEDSKAKVFNNETITRIARAARQTTKNLNTSLKAIVTSTLPATTSTSATTVLLTSDLLADNTTHLAKSEVINNFGSYNIGLTLLNKNLTTSQGVGVEIIITFIFMLTIFACLDSNRKDLSGSFPLTIGFAIAIGCFFGVNFVIFNINIWHNLKTVRAKSALSRYI